MIIPLFIGVLSISGGCLGFLNHQPYDRKKTGKKIAALCVCVRFFLDVVLAGFSFTRTLMGISFPKAFALLRVVQDTGCNW